jgi:hypothetical protein
MAADAVTRLLRRSRPWLPSEEIVTGERLEGLAEIAIVPPEIRAFHVNVERYAREIVPVDGRLSAADLRRVSSKRSLFVYTHEMPEFIERVWPSLEEGPYVLITHNSDAEIDASYLPWINSTGDKLAAWFAQNATVGHPKLRQLPVVIANSMWPHGNLRVLKRAMARDRKPRELVYLEFNTATHPQRPDIRETLRRAFPALSASPPGHMDYRSYLRAIAGHQFWVCPRGNGIDTHRFWECLYLEGIPIVERSAHTEYWRRTGLPLVLVDDWADVTPDWLDSEARLHESLSVREPLSLSHYAQRVLDVAQDAPAIAGATCPDPAR